MAPRSSSSRSPTESRGPGPAIRLERVVARYRRGVGWRDALRAVDLHLPGGSITAVVGANGAGKTTLFRLLLGFLTPAAGRVSVGGVPPRRYRRRVGVGYLPEIVGLPPGWPVTSFLARGVRLAGLRGREARAALERALVQTRLDPDTLDGLTSTLSKGAARRVALAFALAGEPRFILLDEPMAGLDPGARARLRSVLESLPREGPTVLMASHDLPEVERLAQRVVVMAGGRVAAVVEDPGPGVAAEIERTVLGEGGTGGGGP